MKAKIDHEITSNAQHDTEFGLTKVLYIINRTGITPSKNNVEITETL